MRIAPDFSIERRRRILPFRNPDDFEYRIEGMRKAGLPVSHPAPRAIASDLRSKWAAYLTLAGRFLLCEYSVAETDGDML